MTDESDASEYELGWSRRLSRRRTEHRKKASVGRKEKLETYQYRAHRWVASLVESDPYSADLVRVLRALLERAKAREDEGSI